VFDKQKTAFRLINYFVCLCVHRPTSLIFKNSSCYNINQVMKKLKGKEICSQKIETHPINFISLPCPKLHLVSIGFPSGFLTCRHLKFQDRAGRNFVWVKGPESTALKG
jgi:hypothetical protein